MRIFDDEPGVSEEIFREESEEEEEVLPGWFQFFLNLLNVSDNFFRLKMIIKLDFLYKKVENWHLYDSSYIYV